MQPVAATLHRPVDRHAVVAHGAILVGQGAVLHAAVIDEAVHVDVERGHTDHRRRAHVVLERGVVVGRAPRVEVGVAGGIAAQHAEQRGTGRRCVDAVVQGQATAPLVEVQRHHVFRIRQAKLEFRREVERQVQCRQVVGIRARAADGAVVRGQQAVRRGIAHRMLGDVQRGAHHPQAQVAADRHLAVAVETGLQVGGALLQAHGPGTARIDVALLARIQRFLERERVVHRLGIEVVDAHAADAGQAVVVAHVVADDPGQLAGVLRGNDAGAVEALRVARSAGAVDAAAIQHHVGGLPAHQATIRVAGAVAGIDRCHHVEVDVRRRTDAAAYAEVELEAGVIEAIVTVGAQDVHVAFALMVAFAGHRLQRVVVRIGQISLQCLWQRDREMVATHVDGDRHHVGREAVRVEHAVATRVDEGARRRRIDRIVGPRRAIGVGELHVALHQRFMRAGRDAADAAGEIAAVVVIQLQVEVARDGVGDIVLGIGLQVAEPLLVHLRGVQLLVPAFVAVVRALDRFAGIARYHGHERAAHPAGRVELVAGLPVELLLAGEERIAGEGETRAQIGLRRRVDAEALALELAVDGGEILAAVERIAGIAVAIDVDIAATQLMDGRGNRRGVEAPEETAAVGGAGRVLAVELAAVLVHAVGGIFQRVIGVGG